MTTKPKDQLALLRRSFPAFLRVIWRHLGLPAPDAVQLDIANCLQHGAKRQVVEAFRGAGKSYIAGAYCTWLLFNDIDLMVLVLSASEDKAADQTQFILRLLHEVPFLQHLAPRDGSRSSMLSFDVAGAKIKQSPSVRAKGITSTITGGRANVILADDIETPDNSATQMMREKIRAKVREFDNIIVPGPDSLILYLGTPQLEDTLYGVLPERGYTVKVWPIRYPSKEEQSRYGGCLAPSLAAELEVNPGRAGQPTEPIRFGEITIAQKELSQGRIGFTLQYMLDPSLADADRNPLRVRDLMVMDTNPERGPEKAIWATSPELIQNDLPNVALKGDRFHRPMAFDGLKDTSGLVVWQPYTGSVMSIDPSGRGKDETAYAVTKTLNSQIFLVASGGFRGGYDDITLEALAAVAKRFKVNRVLIEDNFGDGMWAKLFTPFLTRAHPSTIELVKAPGTVSKEARIIDILEPVLSTHRLIVDRSVIQNDFDSTLDLPEDKRLQYQLIYQMTRITRRRGALVHDDRLDAVAWAVWYWSKAMSGDQDARVKESRERWLDEQIEAHLNCCLGYKRPAESWLSSTLNPMSRTTPNGHRTRAPDR